MKQKIIGDIITKLSAMMLPVSLGNGADITIHTEFLDASWSTGSKKISYEASVFLDESKQTLLMYEKTTELGHGISFGETEESSFQSGKTLFRKVKSVQYGADGKAYEYTLDLGAIPKAVKETAEQYGWKFKTVLSRKKASFPEGYIPVASETIIPPSTMPAQSIKSTQPATPTTDKFCTNCGTLLNEGAAFCAKCGNSVGTAVPPSELQIPSAASFQQTQNYQQPIPQPKLVPKKKKTGVLYWVLFALTTIMTLLFGLSAGITWPYLLIIVAVLLLMFVFGLKGVIKGSLAAIIVWIVVFVALLLVVGAFILSSDDNGKSGDTGGSPVAAQAEKKGDPAQAVFALSDIRSNIYPHIDSKVVNGEELYKPHADITSFIDLQAVSSAMGYDSANLVQISVDNIEITSLPKKGILTYYVDFSTPAADDTKFTSLSSYSSNFDSSADKYVGASLAVFMKVDNISDYIKIPDTITDSDDIITLVSTWEDLKYTLEFDITAIAKDGNVYSKHIAITMPQGDFMNDDNALNYNVTYDLTNDLANAMLIKQ